MKNFLFVLIILVPFGCKPSNEKTKSIDSNHIRLKETKNFKDEIDSIYSNMGLIREDGRFLNYVCKEDEVHIEYGNYNFKKTLEENYPYDFPNVATPILWWENEDFICLNFGCGNPCWGTKILPLNEKDSVQTYMYQYAYNKDDNIIIHLVFEEKSDNEILVARNLDTQDIKEIFIDSSSTRLVQSIDSVDYSNNLCTIYLREKNQKKEASLNEPKVIKSHINF